MMLHNLKIIVMIITICFEYQPKPSSTGGTRSPPATPHRLQHLTARFIQNGRRGLERGPILGRSRPLLLNKFSDPSTPCISTNQRPRNPKWPPGAPKWPTGSEKGSNPRLLGAPVNFC